MNNDLSDNFGFSYRATKGGEVHIRRQGKTVTTLRDYAAKEFLSEIAGLSDTEQQQLMARSTGNYKRGNERTAKNHPRNRDY
jgi:hypothetical protein